MITDQATPAAILAIYNSVADEDAWSRLLDELEMAGVPRHLLEADELHDECLEQLATDESVGRPLRDLLPHIRRAWTLRREFVAREHTRDVFGDALRPANLGIVIVDAQLDARWASPGAEACYRRYGIGLRDSEPEHVNASARVELQAAVSAVLDGGGEVLVRVPAVSSGSRFLEVRVSSTDPGKPGATTATLLASEVGEPSEVPFLRRLQEAHGFTSAEARVASLAFKGCSPREIAAQAGCSYETARTHLRTIRAKTGTSSHAQLVALLHRGLAPLCALEQE